MSVQYREGNKQIRPNNYEKLQQLTNCASCPSSCSCDLGSRSSFDQLQYQSMVLGQNNYAFDKTRKLNLDYTNEGYSGMVDPYNPITSYIWPPLSCNGCGTKRC